MSYVIKAVLSNPRRPECGWATIVWTGMMVYRKAG